jgi:hypothetical protein
MRNVQVEHMRTIRDLGLMPEWEMHMRIPGVAPYEMARRGEDMFPLERILSVIDLHGQDAGALSQLMTLAGADDAAIRYWAVVGLANHRNQTPETLAVLRRALKDPSVDIHLAAAEILCRSGHESDTLATLASVLKHPDGWVKTRALDLIDELDEKAQLIVDGIKQARDGGYVNRMVPHVLEGIPLLTLDDRQQHPPPVCATAAWAAQAIADV